LTYALLRTHRIDGSPAKCLIDSLTKVKVPIQRVVQVRGLIAAIAINAQFFSIARKQLVALRALESEVYIAKNPDLLEGYKDQALIIALEHFVDHGREEGRDGFYEMQRVAQVTSSFLQRPIGLRQISDQFEETFVEPQSTVESSDRVIVQ
jgi:hypothetical protein